MNRLRSLSAWFTVSMFTLNLLIEVAAGLALFILGLLANGHGYYYEIIQFILYCVGTDGCVCMYCMAKQPYNRQTIVDTGQWSSYIEMTFVVFKIVNLCTHF